jgi:nucleotide-binding universal stress UspA family protein
LQAGSAVAQEAPVQAEVDLMSFKTIVVHCDGGQPAASRLDLATTLASRFGAFLVGVHAKPPFESPAFIDGGYDMAPLLEAHQEQVEADMIASRTNYDRALRGRSLSTEWRSLSGRAGEMLGLCARYADLVILGQSDPDDSSKGPPDLPETVALASGRPVLVVPHIGVEKAIGDVVMLCWNASRESARAAADALPILKAAKQVIVLAVEPKATAGGHGPEPGADVAAWLARHGVKVTVQRDVAPNADVGNIILSRAADHDVDLIVMGIYGHSRMREMILGGVSRTILASMTVPVLMAH